MGGRKWIASIIREDRILSRENYAANILSSDLATLRGFGKWDSITNLEEVDISETLRKIGRHAPNTFYLLRVKHAADRLRR